MVPIAAQTLRVPLLPDGKPRSTHVKNAAVWASSVEARTMGHDTE